MNPWLYILFGGIASVIGTLSLGYGINMLSENSKQLEKILLSTKSDILNPIENIAKDLSSIKSLKNDNNYSNEFIAQNNVYTNKMTLMGISLEGFRNNLITSDLLDLVSNQLINKATSQLSKITKGLQDVSIELKPKEIIELSFSGSPKKQRKDYTFSFITYNESNTLNNFDFEISISDGNDIRTIKYNANDMNYDNIVKSNSIKYYRPELSYIFPEIPQRITCKIRVTNKSFDNERFSIIFPVIEEGLFASSPIMNNEYRSADFLSLDISNELINEPLEKGTISFLFKPIWSSNRLTENINPHLFYWVSKNNKNGILIISDSNDNGKFKVIIIKDGIINTISSDVVPLRNEVYAFDLRFDKQKADFVINGRNISTSHKTAFPNLNKINSKIYLGIHPKSEDLSAFGVFRNLRIYNRWLDDESIKREIVNSEPNFFTYLKEN